MKVLSPAGDMESLKVAVYNGADEVYLGVKDFNARNIETFNLESLKNAVDFAHIYGVRVFLAVNILFDDNEIQSALDLVVDAYNLGVDAFIIQDIGLINLIHTYYQEIEIHASTQMGIHNLEGVKFLEQFGVKRVVLSRETPLDEIKRIKENSNVEIEYFVQGALCVSFSGNCYMSSYMCNASGNRGKCKQLCRLPYTLKFNNQLVKSGYLLSAKDFNMIDKLDELKDAGVDSLKIEGRARRPYYVGVATRMYRNAVDKLSFNKEEIKLAFNRNYTAGYFDGNGNIISNIQSHIGIEIGKVVDFKKGKKFNELFVSTDYDIPQKSTLKIFRKGKEVATLSAFDITKVDNLTRITTTQTLKENDTVNLINDSEKEKLVLSRISKRKIKIQIIAKKNDKICAKFALNNKNYEVFGSTCEVAKNNPLSTVEIKNNFAKSEYFNCDIDSTIEDVFLPKRLLNEFRRNVFSKIEEILTTVNHEKLEKTELFVPNTSKLEFKDFQFVENILDKFESQNIIYCPGEYSQANVEQFILKCENENKTPILNLPNFALSKDIEMLKDIVETNGITILVNNLYAMNFGVPKIIGGGLNVYNSFSAKVYDLPYTTSENSRNIKMPYMTLRHCPMKQHLNSDCAHCLYKDGYSYEMENRNVMKLKRIKMSTCTFYLTD